MVDLRSHALIYHVTIESLLAQVCLEVIDRFHTMDLAHYTAQTSIQMIDTGQLPAAAILLILAWLGFRLSMSHSGHVS